MPLDSFIVTENLLNLAAVIYRTDDDVDRVLASYAASLQTLGHRIGGVVQCNRRDASGSIKLMELIDVMTAQAIPICQNLGSGSSTCSLDQAGFADAAKAVGRAIDDKVEIVFVNKFGKAEAEGRGLRAEIADAIMAGIPVLTAVSERLYPAWTAFTGGFGTTMLCDIEVIDDWWREISSRTVRRRNILAGLSPMA